MQAVAVVVHLVTVAQTKLVNQQMEELAEVTEVDVVLLTAPMLETIRLLDQEMLELQT
jgi:pantothenate synthetase